MNELLEVKDRRPIVSDNPLVVEAAPLLKWVGGKDQLLEDLLRLIPLDFGNYVEPFIGGGSIYFAMRRLGRIRRGAYLADLNRRLVTTYRAVRGFPEAVLSELTKLSQDKTEPAYRQAVKEFNQGARESRTGVVPLFGHLPPPAPARMAALFIYLNRLCFNGLFRENLSGEFNVGYGKNPKKDTIRADSIRAASVSLAQAEILEADFTLTLSLAGRDDFAMMDPPYVPLTETANFNQYTADGFGMDQQDRLARACRELDRRGGRFLLCNSAHPSVIELYKGFEVRTVKATRNVNCKGDGRGEVDEVLILNYQPTGT